MASVNASRESQSRSMSRAVDRAKVIGFNDAGVACVWYGGHSLSMYDAARDWEEVRHVTSSQLMSISDMDSDEAYQHAKARMLSEGFRPVE